MKGDHCHLFKDIVQRGRPLLCLLPPSKNTHLLTKSVQDVAHMHLALKVEVGGAGEPVHGHHQHVLASSRAVQREAKWRLCTPAAEHRHHPVTRAFRQQQETTIYII